MIKEAAMMHYGKIFTGHRHHNIIQTIILETGDSPMLATQGFITDDGLFLNREEAYLVAIKCGQYKGDHSRGKRLYSEDLY